jgi:N utilization substance protein B
MSFALNSKTISRIAAVQSIYCHYATNLDINKVIQDVKIFYINQQYSQDGKTYEVKLHEDHFINLVQNTLGNIVDIDKAISINLAQKWTLEALHLTLISILRVGVAELCYYQNAPFKVIINEFTNIANEMLGEKEVPFINSILQKIHDQNIPKQDDPFI